MPCWHETFQSPKPYLHHVPVGLLHLSHVHRLNPRLCHGAQDKCHPQTIAVCQTRAAGLGLKVEVCSEEAFAFGKEVCGALVQYPATDGTLHHYEVSPSPPPPGIPYCRPAAGLSDTAVAPMRGSVQSIVAIHMPQITGRSEKRRLRPQAEAQRDTETNA